MHPFLDADAGAEPELVVHEAVTAIAIVEHLLVMTLRLVVAQVIPGAAAVGNRSIKTRLTLHIHLGDTGHAGTIELRIALVAHILTGGVARRTRTKVNARGRIDIGILAVHTRAVAAIVHIVGITHLLSESVSVPAGIGSSCTGHLMHHEGRAVETGSSLVDTREDELVVVVSVNGTIKDVTVGLHRVYVLPAVRPVLVRELCIVRRSHRRTGTGAIVDCSGGNMIEVVDTELHDVAAGSGSLGPLALIIGG